MHIDVEHNWAYDKRHAVDGLSGVGDWVKRWTHWGVCGTTLRWDRVTYFYMLFLRCAEEELYACPLTSIVRVIRV